MKSSSETDISPNPGTSQSPGLPVPRSPGPFSEALSATIERIRAKREERVRAAPPCAVCGNSILSVEPSSDLDQWTLFNATHDKLCFTHFEEEYSKVRISWRRENAGRCLVSAGVSQKFSDRSFDNYVVTEENSQLFTAVSEWAENPSSFLSILSPQTGIGKTHLAIAALRKFFLDTGSLGKFRKEGPLLLGIRKGYNTLGSLPENDAIESLTKPGILVYDDLFSSKEATEGIEFARRIALAFIDAREWEGKATVVTSNLTLSSIAAIDRRLSSRLSAGVVLNIRSTIRDYRCLRHNPGQTGGSPP